ncbi:MAG: Ig-like domain-containing protein, partial [Candidatus Thermoplasmatota archaeon]
YPLEGQTVNGTITISGTASDPDLWDIIKKVEVKIDNSNWQLATNTIVWSFIWNTTTVPNGLHTIYARAYDGIDYSDIKTVSVLVDNPTVVQILEPTTGANVIAAYTGYGVPNISVAVAPPEPPPELSAIGIYINITVPETITLSWLYIEVPYNEALLPEGVKEGDLRLYYWNETSGKWESCSKIGITDVNTENNIVWANVTHLTIFAPMAEKIAVAPAPLTLLIYAGIAAVVIIIAVSLIVIKRRRKK